ncbi:hypothetical protein M3Y98_00603900 [Aphelenchoides besseyi]|nr:hypothetical protein M3Y98_00603900 [Aphelenchoides besseyi]KAI6208217.1 hypothetical protein M3Y96_00091900 [Aphelenchoides besseyi]
MSDKEKRKSVEEVDSLDVGELAKYGEMVEHANDVEEKPSANERTEGGLEGMDPVTGDFIRPPQTSTSNNLAGETNEPQPTEDDKEDENKEKKERSKDRRNRKQLRRQLSKRIMNTINAQRKEDVDEEEEIADNCIFGNQIRFTIMIISTLCLSSILSNILTYNFAFICMAGERPQNYTSMTLKEIQASGYREDLDYSSGQRSALFMAVAVGSLLAVFPMTIALNKFGSRMVFGGLGFVSAIATLLFPLSTSIGFVAVFIMRVFQGVGFSACLPVMGSITSHWSTLKQNGIFIAILSSFLQVSKSSSCQTNLFTDCSNLYNAVVRRVVCFGLGLAINLLVSKQSDTQTNEFFSIHGIISVILFLIFIFYHRNSPSKHPLMKRRELVKVMFGKGSIYSGPNRQKKSKKVPYDAFFRDPAIWAVLVAAFGNFMGTQLSLQFMPTYINKVLFLPVEQTGMASAISPIIMFVIKLVAGQSSDKITIVSDVWKLRIYNSLSCGMMGVLFIVLALLDPVDQPSLCLIVLLTSTCILGFNSGGFYKSSQMVSRQHSHFTMALVSFLNCVCMLIVPLLNEIIAPENLPENWAIVLWIHAGCLIITNGFFCIFCSASPAPWTLDTWISRANKQNRASVRQPLKTEKIGIFLSTLSNSQIVFGTQLAEVLRNDGHNIVLIRAQLNPEATLSRGNFREIRLDALDGQSEVFYEFYRIEQRVIFEDHGLLSPIYIEFAKKFHQLLNVSSNVILSNETFLRELRNEDFDLFYVNHHQHFPLAVARYLNVRYIRFSSASLGRSLAHFSGIPPMASITPSWLSSFSDQMTYLERAMNLFLSLMESTEDYALNKLDVLYQSYFGSDFPSAQQLSREAELCLVNDEEMFNYPRLISHKIVYIGGLGQDQENKKLEIDSEYVHFIDNHPTVLLSLGSVANSTQMPREWKDEFVKLFDLMKDVRFIWKYDGTDVRTPSNVLIKKWLPQNELLKSGKITAFLTHAGYNSLSESLYAAVPVVLLPTFADQLRNANLAKVRGIGLIVKKSEVRAEILAERISTVYLIAARKFQKLLKSKPFTAEEKIIRWNRFVLNNSVDLNVATLNFIQYYCLDIIIPFALVTPILAGWISYKLFIVYYWSCCGMQKKSKHVKKE